MYERILVATDGSDSAKTAVDHAAYLASALKAELYMVHVSEPLPTFAPAEIGWSVPSGIYDEMQRAADARASHILNAAAELARRQGSNAHPIHIAGQPASSGILEAAATSRADIIVLASHSKSLVDRLLLGSQASKVVSLSPIPVLVVRG